MAKFVFDADYTFEWPVVVKMPSGGADTEMTFTGIFKLPADEAAFFAPAKITTSIDLIMVTRSRLSDHWVGWRDIELPDGTAVPYSEAAKAALLAMRPVREAVDRAFSAGALGVREKN